MKVGERVFTPSGPAVVTRVASIVITQDAIGLKCVWNREEVRPIPEPEDEDEETTE
jgi:hypothetical protein